MYKKGLLENDVKIVSPMEIGGLKCAEYLAMNPQARMPLLKVEDSGMCIPESDIICRYLISQYADRGPSFQLEDVKSNLIARFHDIYLSPLQGCMYKATPPFAQYGMRKDALEEFRSQMKIIDDMIDNNRDGIYLRGKDVSLADVTLFPTMVFAKYMLPKFGEKEPLPPKINAWFDNMVAQDLDFRRVHDEVSCSILHVPVLLASNFYQCQYVTDLVDSSWLLWIRLLRFTVVSKRGKSEDDGMTFGWRVFVIQNLQQSLTGF
jgi:glutathione S-transferase